MAARGGRAAGAVERGVRPRRRRRRGASTRSRTRLPLPGGTITYHVEVINVGSADTDGSAITTTITLPQGLTGVSAERASGQSFGLARLHGGWRRLRSRGEHDPVHDDNRVPDVANGARQSPCDYTIVVAVDAGVAVPPSTLTTTFDVTGGGAATVTHGRSDADRRPAGVWARRVRRPDRRRRERARRSTQAGGHPYAITTSIDFNTVTNPLPLIGDLWPVEPVKDALVDLPPGLGRQPGGRRSMHRLPSSPTASARAPMPLCPATSQIGTVVVRVNGFNHVPVHLRPDSRCSTWCRRRTRRREFGFNVLGYGRDAHAPGCAATATTGSRSTATTCRRGLRSPAPRSRSGACPRTRATTPTAPARPGRAWRAVGRPARAARRRVRSCAYPTSCAAPAGSPVQDGLATNISIDSWDHPGARDANGDAVAGDPNWQHATWVTHASPGYPTRRRTVRAAPAADRLRQGAVRPDAELLRRWARRARTRRRRSRSTSTCRRATIRPRSARATCARRS